MGFIGILLGYLVAIGTRGRSLYLLELRQVAETAKHIHQMRIGERA